MLTHRLRRWPSNNPPLGQRLVFTGVAHCNMTLTDRNKMLSSNDRCSARKLNQSYLNIGPLLHTVPTLSQCRGICNFRGTIHWVAFLQFKGTRIDLDKDDHLIMNMASHDDYYLHTRSHIAIDTPYKRAFTFNAA